MIQLRPELKRAAALLIVFIALFVTTELLAPLPIQSGQYTRIEARRIAEAPESYDGLWISTTVRVESVEEYDENRARIISNEGLVFLYPLSLDSILPGDTLLVRGVVQVETFVYVEVSDAHSHDSLSSPIRSIPGIVIFVLLLFYMYRLDLNQVALVPRRDRNT